MCAHCTFKPNFKPGAYLNATNTKHKSKKYQNTPTLAQISEVSSSCYLKGYGDVMQSHGVNIKANVTDKM